MLIANIDWKFSPRKWKYSRACLGLVNIRKKIVARFEPDPHSAGRQMKSARQEKSSIREKNTSVEASQPLETFMIL